MTARKKAAPYKLPSCINAHNRKSSQGPTVSLVGEGPYAYAMLHDLLKEGVNVRHYFGGKGSKKSRVYESCGVEVHKFKGQRDLPDLVQAETDYTAIFNLGYIFPEETIEEISGEFLNIHPSPLPELKGAKDPVGKMLKQGRVYGAVTVHQVTPRIDDGKILGQSDFLLQTDPERKKSKSEIEQIIFKRVIPVGAGLMRKIIRNRSKIEPMFQSDWAEKVASSRGTKLARSS